MPLPHHDMSKYCTKVNRKKKYWYIVGKAVVIAISKHGIDVSLNKIREKILTSRIKEHIDDRNVIPYNQHGNDPSKKLLEIP